MEAFIKNSRMRLSIQELKKGVQRVIDGLSREELAGLLTRLAEAQKVEDRSTFLETLELCQTKPRESAETPKMSAADRLKSIMKQAKKRQKHIENGDYEMLEDWDWEEMYYDGYGRYEHEEPEALNEDLMDEINEIVREADNYFLDQRFNSAGPVYKALLEFELEAVSVNLIFGSVFEDQEIWFRHLRCVYENSKPRERNSRLYEEMKSISNNSKIFPTPLPSLRKISATCSEAVSGYKDFLPEWAAFLHTQNGPTAKRLWVEALILMGRNGEALTWLETNGQEYSQAWLEYLECLGQREELSLLAEGCDKALRQLSAPRDRIKAANHLIDAGLKLNKTAHLVTGYRAAVLANPSLRVLESMVAAVPRGEERDELLKSIDAHLPVKEFSRTHAVVKMLLGNILECLEAVEKDKTVGWSNSETPMPAVVSGGMLALCAGKAGKNAPLKVRHFADLYLNSHREMFMLENFDDNNSAKGGLIPEILKSFEAKGGVSPETQAVVMDFTRRAVRARAERIVSNTYRNAYGKAAAGLLAWAETARVLGRKQEGDNLIKNFKSSYPRHRAFLRELV